MTQISIVILIYEIFYYLLYLCNILRNTQYISWILFPHILIISVVLFVECRKYGIYPRLFSLLTKVLLLIPLLLLPIKINNINYIICLIFTLSYYFIINISDYYSCNIDTSDLLISFLWPTVIAEIIFLLYFFFINWALSGLTSYNW